MISPHVAKRNTEAMQDPNSHHRVNLVGSNNLSLAIEDGGMQLVSDDLEFNQLSLSPEPPRVAAPGVLLIPGCKETQNLENSCM